MSQERIREKQEETHLSHNPLGSSLDVLDSLGALNTSTSLASDDGRQSLRKEESTRDTLLHDSVYLRR